MIGILSGWVRLSDRDTLWLAMPMYLNTLWLRNDWGNWSTSLYVLMKRLEFLTRVCVRVVTYYHTMFL